MKKLIALCFLSFSVFLIQCGKDNSASTDAYHNDNDLPTPENPRFELLSKEVSGIDFNNVIEEDFMFNVIRFAYLYNGSGVGVLDINNDGLQDVYFISTTGSCKMYQNEGNLKFKDITEQAGVAASTGVKTGVTVVDINADGWQDIYVCRSGMQANDDRRNLLFVNQKNGTFKEEAAAYGLNDPAACSIASFFDYDNDGDLDMYLVVYPDDFSLVNQVLARDMGNGVIQRFNEPKDPMHSDRLYRNNGDGTFSNISQVAGIWNRAFGLSINISDFNNDGWQDIYVCNDYIEPDFLYINTGNGSFREQNLKTFNHSSENSMGSDLADFNNDGLLDLVSVDMLSEDYVLQKERLTSRTNERYNTLNGYGYGHQQERNVLQLNNGNGTYSDIACLAGVFQTDWSWSVLAQDFDNNGWKDIFVTNGYRRDITNADYMMFTSDSINKNGGLGPETFDDIYEFYEMIPSHKLQNYVFKNTGGLQYENASTPWGLVQKTYSTGAAYADLDNDGDLELIVNNIEREAFIYKNTSADKKDGNWLQVKLTGSAANPFATGAKARITVGSQVQYQELNPTRGFESSVEALFHFGLGNADKVDKLEVEFPGQRLLVQTNIKANQRLSLDFENAQPGRLSPLPEPQAFVQDLSNTRGLVYTHKEDDFFDFDRERLLPWRLSTPGPEIATGDANGDGREDFYICGSTGSPGALMVQTAAGTFSEKSKDLWAAEAGYEDADAVFVDFDGDGDQDLVVASGGNTQPAGSPLYGLRLYRNDGAGGYSPSVGATPEITTSIASISAHDYDGDGDQDLILGGYCTPGAYPMAPASYILQNNGKGVFADATGSACPEFATFGMVRDMVWADLNGDKRDELVVLGEWTPVTVFKVKDGKFTNASSSFGLDGTNGFWNVVQAADVDGDGDQDLICGNLGYNTRFRASSSEPLELYANDFDGNGSIDPIMTRYFNGGSYPLATRDLLIKQIPKLKKQFVRYTPFARATIDKIYSKEELDKCYHLQAEVLASVVLINENGKLVMKNLPDEAQIAPVHAIVTTDVNGDGKMDLILAGNDYGQQVETGRVDSGNGTLLLGDGKGGFRPVSARESGLWANKQVRSLALVQAGGKPMLLVGNNNDKMQVFSW